jgi:hypothetical protein
LPNIKDYVSEVEMWQALERVWPRVLGALLDVVSAALTNEPDVELLHPPRMADFAVWVAAAAPALEWDAEQLLDVYAANRAQANETTLEASPLVAPLRAIGKWEGTATELLAKLTDDVDGLISRSKAWPKSPRALSGDQRRLAPALRRGQPPLLVEFDREANKRRIRICGV